MPGCDCLPHQAKRFQKIVQAGGKVCTLRISKGDDEMAGGCGGSRGMPLFVVRCHSVGARFALEEGCMQHDIVARGWVLGLCCLCVIG